MTELEKQARRRLEVERALKTEGEFFSRTSSGTLLAAVRKHSCKYVVTESKNGEFRSKNYECASGAADLFTTWEH